MHNKVNDLYENIRPGDRAVGVDPNAELSACALNPRAAPLASGSGGNSELLERERGEGMLP